MNTFSRRGFITASAAVIAAAQMPRIAFAQTAAPIVLTATTRTLDIAGRAATVFGLVGPGGPGLILDPGQRFRVDLTNDLDVPTIVHWHGQIPPNAQDGVQNTAPLLSPGEMRSYDFATRLGTYWMHAHVVAHEMQLLAAPLIVRAPEDLSTDRQEVVLFLHDFSFKTPDDVLAEIAAGGAGHGDMSMMGHPMHLQGLVFQVVGLNGRRIAGALRDTVYVPPMEMVEIALDVGEAAPWLLHCHHMAHMATGMMTEFSVTARA
ncbi:MAG: multicopper oxidase domain-containing protein [Pseudorhodobacter sp.]|nr:multicopper oxidase domain-containing protein [Pseudorhodobacter sp.]